MERLRQPGCQISSRHCWVNPRCRRRNIAFWFLLQ